MGATIWSILRRRVTVLVVVVAGILLLVLVLTAGSGPDHPPARHTTTATSVAPTHTSITLPTASAVTTVPTSPTGAGPDCGGSVPDIRGTWTCTFDDEFNADQLDRFVWTVQRTSNSGYRAGDDCYVDSPRTVSESGGTLNLTAVKEPRPFTCEFPGGSYTTQYASGMVSTDNTFSQTYGLFEVRASFPAATRPGLQSTLWLWPQNAKEYGPSWPDSGEIDFAEWFSQYAHLDIPNVHYNAQPGDTTTADCALTDPSGFHIYGVLWTPTRITTYLDGTTCFSDDWHPSPPEFKSEPFNQPFFIILTQALGINSNFTTSATPFPATTRIDWVRVWKSAASGSGS